MATKRSRRVVQTDDEDEAVGVTHASSQLRHDDSRKRARVSLAGASNYASPRQHDETSSTESEEEDEEDEEDEDDGSRRAQSPPKTQYEITRDAGYKHLRYIEQDTQRATQKIRSRPALIGENHAAESGIIESIECINFMCHDNLVCELGPLINFIVGENGSGKSAVLTAITLCLGGKASATNRGGSLKDLIKQGKDHSIIRVRLKNQGRDAYQHDVYGDTITIERHFSRKGTSGFKIVGTDNKVKSTKRQDVDDISEYWCLQVDNPLNVLSQDNARQFLNSSSAAQKYKFFVQGVQLEQLDNDYRLLQDIFDQNQERLVQHSATAEHQKRELEEAKRLAQTVQQNAELRARIRLYTNQMAWAQVVEQEMVLQAIKRRIAALEGQIAEMQQAIETQSGALLQADEKFQQAKLAHDALLEEQPEHQARLEQAELAFNEARKTLQALHAEERDIRARLEAAHAEVVACEESIQTEEARLTAANGDLPAQKRAELDRARQIERDLKDEFGEHRAGLAALMRKQEDDQKEVDRMDGLVKAKRTEVGNVERQLRTMQQSGSDTLGFEERMPALQRLIEGDNGFAQKPIGPLGAHIQLLKPIWGSVIERTLGQSLQAFIVTSKSDQHRLSALMQRAGVRHSPIFIGGRTQLNTEGKEPAEELDTILRVLKFDNNMIRDHLIINNYIDQTVLVNHRHDAEKIVFDGHMSRNVLSCISHHDTQRGCGIRFSNKNGNTSSAFISAYRGTPRLRSNRNDQIAELMETRKQLSLEVAELEKSRRLVLQSRQKSSGDITAHKKQHDNLDRAIRQAGADIATLSDDLDAFEGAGGRLDALREDLREAQEKETHEGNQWATMCDAKPAQNKIAEEKRAKLREAKEAQQDFASRLTKAERKVKQAGDLRRIAIGQKNEAIEASQVQQHQRGILDEDRAAQEEKIQGFIDQAAQIAPKRVEIAEGETYTSIETKYEKIREQLAKRKRQVGMDDNQILDRQKAAMDAYERTVREITQMKQTQETLRDTIIMRMDRWRKFQRFISARARASFLYLLSERACRGNLVIDHANKKLELKVEPDDTQKSAAGRSTKTLSGGEKSFSSICLLLSIWEAMGSPLRCLDEFDVFMDNVNRTVSTSMLIQAARRSVSRQYILITPNAIEGRANLDKDVKIIRLIDPRQRTLV